MTQPQHTPEMETEQPPPWGPEGYRIPWRALVLGLAMVLTINIGAPYAMYIIHSSQWSISYLPLAVVFLFTALVFFNATIVSLTGIRGLSRTELSLIFMMALVGASIPTWGTSTYLIAVIAAPKFFASAENGWQTTIVKYIKEWLVPQDMTALR
ncbi:MAG TPA: hypothetical protein EYQ31_16635, partial [Candidatus Handelsmanbacteria bacterium]|nr:hypothetical protein [Candidatus Handelsmanbacteria bacterium]